MGLLNSFDGGCKMTCKNISKLPFYYIKPTQKNTIFESRNVQVFRTNSFREGLKQQNFSHTQFWCSHHTTPFMSNTLGNSQTSIWYVRITQIFVIGRTFSLPMYSFKNGIKHMAADRSQMDDFHKCSLEFTQDNNLNCQFQCGFSKFQLQLWSDFRA